MKRWYIGKAKETWEAIAFSSDTTPTKDTHGHLYGYVIGPFRTKCAALWAQENPAGYVTVAEAERQAKA